MLPPLERVYRGRSTSAGGAIDGVRLIDVGSGAGLPGLILAVARPSWKFTLLESMRKRCTFLEHAVEAMNLSNVDVVCDRAEKVGQSLDFRESYDIVAARAVAELKVLAEYCIPLVRIGGLFIAAKGHDPHEEVRNAEGAIKKLGASMLELCNGIVSYFFKCAKGYFIFVFLQFYSHFLCDKKGSGGHRTLIKYELVSTTCFRKKTP